jgi:hypothetical protein
MKKRRREHETISSKDGVLRLNQQIKPNEIPHSQNEAKSSSTSFHNQAQVIFYPTKLDTIVYEVLGEAI